MTADRRVVSCCLAVGLLTCVTVAFAADDLVVYDDSLTTGWQDWSWATHNLSNPSPVHGGSASISMELAGWDGLYFHSTSAYSTADYEALELWVHGGAAGGQTVILFLWYGGETVAEVELADVIAGGSIPAGSFAEVAVDFAALGLGLVVFDEIVIQNGTGTDQGTIYIDDIVLIGQTGPPPVPDPVAVTIQPDLDRRLIDPRIYGVNFGSYAEGVPPYPLRRWGGNSTSRYNWQAGVSSRGSDWFYFNIVGDHPNPDQLPDGNEVDVFVEETWADGGEPLITVPLIGWTPSPERVKKWSFSIDKYGPQTLTECTYFDPPPFWCEPDAGNGECDPVENTTGYCVGSQIVDNEPLDASVPITSEFVTDWVAHLQGRYGTASEGGMKLYALDNEPMLWDSTHRDVHPEPLTYDGLWAATLDIAQAIKAQEPDAVVFGPVVWGWCAYFSSAADAAYPNGSCIDGPDRTAHDGTPVIEWYLEQICEVESQTGVRPVDILDVHFYPQGGVSGLGGAGEDAQTAARRLRSLKELYDPDYVSESWIAQPVKLIPRMREWIDDACPGVGLAVTEYRWGSDDGPSGALAQAEVLAIFGREGVDVATRWVSPDSGTRTEDAFRLFLDYDGALSRVVGDSVRAVSADVDVLGAYAVRTPDDELLVLLFNKDVLPRLAEVEIAATLEGTGDAFFFDGTNALGPLGPVAPTATGFSLELSPRSATIVRFQMPTDSLFADGFESGHLGAWSASVPPQS